MDLHSYRRFKNRLALTVSMLAMGFGLVWLVWILATTIELGIAGINLHLFTQMTPPPGSSEGGLANAIYGSVMMVSIAVAIGTPVGMFAGIYLAEFGKHTWLGSTTRFVNDLLLSAPSIIVGLFIYELVVARMGNFSGIAGALSLSLIVIPVVIRTTENMLQLVPNAMREAAFALGAPKWVVIGRVTLKASLAGVMTGVMLAIARISGETAPLLFTALSNQFWSADLDKPMASLPVTIFKFAMSPYTDWQQLAWAGVFLITIGVLFLNIAARFLFRAKHKQ
ncbi:MAG: phosphate ABC transporter permease PstA [Rhodocyclaceae bacterium]|nr:MAG: phosphate ABC transporter permease PstA [Rhodocyclaceae bacterium]